MSVAASLLPPVTGSVCRPGGGAGVAGPAPPKAARLISERPVRQYREASDLQCKQGIETQSGLRMPKLEVLLLAPHQDAPKESSASSSISGK
jgi:hypothetical protein